MTGLERNPSRASRAFGWIVGVTALPAVVVFALPSASWADAQGAGPAGAGPASASPAAAGPAGTTPGGAAAPAGTETALQAQAQEIASQIQAGAEQLDQIDEAYNAAQLRYQEVTAEQTIIEHTMSQTSELVARTRRDLKEQAVLDYLAGGAPVAAYVPSRPDTDRSITAAYAEIVAGGQKRAVDAYRSALAAQASQAAQLARARQQASVILADVQSDRSAVQATLASQHQVLDQVKGQLSALVAGAEATQQKAEQHAVEAAIATTSGVQAPGVDQTSAATPSAGTGGPPTAVVVAEPLVVATPQTTPPSAPAPSRPSAPRPPPATASPTVNTTRASPTTSAPAPVSTLVPVRSPAPFVNTPAPGAGIAIAYARAQLGKPYQWGGAGPNSFDCSGLVMMAWAKAGVYFPHLAESQYDMTRRIPLGDLLPGDLVFYGTPSDVYHVGLYIGSGDMIDAPATGQKVHITSIYWDGLLGGGRVES